MACGRKDKICDGGDGYGLPACETRVVCGGYKYSNLGIEIDSENIHGMHGGVIFRRDADVSGVSYKIKVAID